jgi:formate hydrogenlyase subunit 4
LFQAYHDLFKLLRKDAVYSRTTTWIFRAGPIVGLAVMLTTLAMVPAGGLGAVLAFPGDFIFLACALGLMRFMTVLSALDTGSAFEGMGASREVQFALLAEPALLSVLAVLAAGTDQLGISSIYTRQWSTAAPFNHPRRALAVFGQSVANLKKRKPWRAERRACQTLKILKSLFTMKMDT